MGFKVWISGGLAAAFAFGVSAPAHATVSEPPTAFMLLPASPGIVVGAGALVTTVGSAVTLAGEEPSVGWSVAAIVVGSLSLTSGAVYSGVVADGNAAPELFATVAASNFAFGASSLVLGIVGVTADVPPEVVSLLPRVSVDAGGLPFAQVRGSF